MIRDVKRRKLATELAPMRLRVNSLRRNDILPPELREIADQEIAAFPLNSTPLRINNRCVITSRPRGVVDRWRVSRIVFRHLADYNKLCGVQRAMWQKFYQQLMQVKSYLMLKKVRVHNYIVLYPIFGKTIKEQNKNKIYKRFIFLKYNLYCLHLIKESQTHVII